MNLEPVTDYLAKVNKLSPSELIWLLAWNIAAGDCDRIGLNATNGKTFLLDLFHKLGGGTNNLVTESALRLQQSLMALRIGTFDEVQFEAPFRTFAQKNMEALTTAWKEGGDQKFTSTWEEIFYPGWQEALDAQTVIEIIGGSGESEAEALEVVGAPDGRTRVAAEYWWLRYRFGFQWTPEMHFTTGNDSEQHFSVHHVKLLDGSSLRIHFRLPW